MNDIFEFQLKKLFLHSLMPSKTRMLELLTEWFDDIDFNDDIVTIYHREVAYKYQFELREYNYINKILIIS